MKYLACILSMPNAGSWNGRWSGASNIYARLIKVSERNKTLMNERLSLVGYYIYDFGDGWSVGINIKEVDITEYRLLNRATVGFYGYDWMINSIIQYKRIMTSDAAVFIDFKNEISSNPDVVNIEITNKIYYDELTFSKFDRHYSLRCYDNRNNHANEHMKLKINGKEVCHITDKQTHDTDHWMINIKHWVNYNEKI